MQHPMPRRTFLARVVGVLGAFAAAASCRPLPTNDPAPREQSRDFFKLSPYTEAEAQQCEDSHNHKPGTSGVPGCAACPACLNHAYFNIFPTGEAAEQHRAHQHCNCRVYQAGTLPEQQWLALFGQPGRLQHLRADFRWSWVQAVAGQQPL